MAHGIRITEGAVGVRPTQTVDLSTVGVIGTAPGADPNGDFGTGTSIAYNTPFRLNRLSDAPASQLGTTGTLPEALRGIFANGNVQTVMVIAEQVDILRGSNLPAAGPNFLTTYTSVTLNANKAVPTGFRIFATGNPSPTYSVTTGTLPAGLTLASATGIISGTPTTVAASTDITFTATNTGGTDTHTVAFTIQAAATNQVPFVVSTIPDQEFVAGTAITSIQLSAIGTPNATWQLKAGNALPDGLSLSTAGVISGTPNTAQDNSRVVFQAINSQGIAEVSVGFTVFASNIAVDASATRTNMIGNSTAQTGVHAFKRSDSVVGVKPRILCAPRFDGERPVGATPGTNVPNPLAAELITVAGEMRSIAVLNGPNTNDADAVDYAGDINSDRAYMVDPWVTVLRGDATVDVPSSPYVAGLISANDSNRNRGWHRSPSNSVIPGITGTARPIGFVMGENSSQANQLNNDNISTIINLRNSYRLWGNKSVSNTAYEFLNVRRTADILRESVEDALVFAIDQGITLSFFDAVEDTVNEFLRSLESGEQILGGECWRDPDLNTPANRQLGRAYFNIRFTPTYPAEEINIQLELTDSFITTV